MENRNNSPNPKTEKRIDKLQQLPPHKPLPWTRKGSGKGNQRKIKQIRQKPQTDQKRTIRLQPRTRHNATSDENRT
jgi:hypothetical protein